MKVLFGEEDNMIHPNLFVSLYRDGVLFAPHYIDELWTGESDCMQLV